MLNQHTSITLTPVNAENFDNFSHLIRKLAEYEHLTPPDQNAQNRLRHDCLQNQPKYHAYLAMVKDKPAGYIIYFYTYSSFLAQPTLFLEDIFVLEEYRKMGVGKALFDFIKAEAKNSGCGRIEFTVLKWNKLAQDFYEKNGAKNLNNWLIYRILKEDF